MGMILHDMPLDFDVALDMTIFRGFTLTESPEEKLI